MEEIVNLQNNLRDKESNINRLEEQLTEKTNEIVNLQSSLRDKESNINRLEEQLTEKTNEIVNLQSNLRDKESNINRLEDQLTEKTEKVERGNQKIRQLEIELENMSTNRTNETNLQKLSNIAILDSEGIKSYEKVKELGHGDTGTAFEVIKKELYVLKELNRLNIESFRNLIKEHEILSMLEHPNVIKTYGIHLGDETTPPSIILEYCTQNIGDAIKNEKLTPAKIISSIYQIAEGMKYIHFKKIIHRDLKPSNIVIAEDGTIKICDFGVSKLIDPESGCLSFTTGIGTLFFMAPEIINENDEYDEKVDVYSFGVLTFFILSGGKMPKIKIPEICSGKKAEIPDEFTQLAKNLINSCWNFDPSQRPSFDEICSLMKDNEYGLIDLDGAGMNEALDLIKEHKKRIPPY